MSAIIKGIPAVPVDIVDPRPLTCDCCSAKEKERKKIDLSVYSNQNIEN
jgi:hypothetical protein